MRPGLWFAAGAKGALSAIGEVWVYGMFGLAGNEMNIKDHRALVRWDPGWGVWYVQWTLTLFQFLYLFLFT